MPAIPLSADAVRRALSIRDLSDPAQGPHAMQQLVDACATRLREAWGCAVRTHRASPIVSVADNYDHLRYPPEGAARDARYTRYVCDVASTASTSVSRTSWTSGGSSGVAARAKGPSTAGARRLPAVSSTPGTCER